MTKYSYFTTGIFSFIVQNVVFVISLYTVIFFLRNIINGKNSKTLTKMLLLFDFKNINEMFFVFIASSSQRKLVLVA